MKYACTPEYLTPEQVATILAAALDTIYRQFGNAEGVIDFGTPETTHKRRKRKLRIPRQKLEPVPVEEDEELLAGMKKWGMLDEESDEVEAAPPPRPTRFLTAKEFRAIVEN